MVKCVVTGCPNRQVDGNVNGEIFNRPVKRFFSFPKDPARVQVWLAALREMGKQDTTKQHLICEDHFLPEDISNNEVTSDAIPIMPPSLDGSLGLSSAWGVESSEEDEQWATGGCDDEDDDEGGDGDAPVAAEPPVQPQIQQVPVGRLSDRRPRKRTAAITSPPTRKRKQSLTGKRDVPLGLLTERFLNLLHSTPEESMDLWQAAVSLQTRKRRLNDITNILFGLDFIEMESANIVKWTAGFPISTLLSGNHQEIKQENESELEDLKLVEDTLDGLIESCTQELFNMTDDAENAAFAYVTHEDIRRLTVFKEQTVIVIKAPEETKLEVSAPKEDSIQVHMKATKTPIMVVTCDVGSDDTMTSDPGEISGLFSTLEESRIMNPAMLTGASVKKEEEDEEHISTGETRIEAPPPPAPLETQRVDRCIIKPPTTTVQLLLLKLEDNAGRKMGGRCRSVWCVMSEHRQCSDITETDRESVFKHFWQDLDWTQRKTYVASLVDVFRAWRWSPRLRRSRMISYMRYHLKVNGRRMRVCKFMFLSTLCVTWDYVSGCTAGTEKKEVAKKASPCSALSAFVASTESQWFGD